MIDLVLQALAEPRRREILKLVQRQELSSGEIAAQFEVTRPAISQHLRLLEEAGLVSVRQVGTRRLYHARPQGFIALRKYLEQYWDDRLERLRQAAEAEERRSVDGHSTGNEPA